MSTSSPHLAIALVVLLASLEDVITQVPADSLAPVLRRTEQRAESAEKAGEAAMMLGRLHYARGEYRMAADAFARAAARLDPSLKAEAHYWAGTSWLAMRSPNPARAAFEAVVASASPRRTEAMLGIATAWEQSDRPDRAYETLEDLLANDPGEAGPPALERYAVLADRFQRPRVAAAARARLLEQYPESMEATAAALSLEAATQAAMAAGALGVLAGRFTTASRAQSLAARAIRVGFADARVIEQGAGPTRSYAVQFGSYATEAEARTARDRAVRILGVNAHVTGRP
jgi:tetratricopeptide (TPR) repeat protein